MTMMVGYIVYHVLYTNSIIFVKAISLSFNKLDIQFFAHYLTI